MSSVRGWLAMWLFWLSFRVDPDRACAEIGWMVREAGFRVEKIEHDAMMEARK